MDDQNLDGQSSRSTGQHGLEVCNSYLKSGRKEISTWVSQHQQDSLRYPAALDRQMDVMHRHRCWGPALIVPKIQLATQVKRNFRNNCFSSSPVPIDTERTPSSSLTVVGCLPQASSENWLKQMAFPAHTSDHISVLSGQETEKVCRVWSLPTRGK